MQMRHCVRGLILSAVQLAISRIDTGRRRAARRPRRAVTRRAPPLANNYIFHLLTSALLA